MIWRLRFVSHSLAKTPFRAAHAPLATAKSNHLGVEVDMINMRQCGQAMLQSDVATLMMPRLRLVEQEWRRLPQRIIVGCPKRHLQRWQAVGILLFGLTINHDDCAVHKQSIWVVSHTATMAQPLPWLLSDSVRLHPPTEPPMDPKLICRLRHALQWRG
jgi:hypothetical protein